LLINAGWDGCISDFLGNYSAIISSLNYGLSLRLRSDDGTMDTLPLLLNIKKP